MKILTRLILACALMGLHGQAAPATTDASGSQLTVELRDGSRIVGQALESTLGFHSTTLGDMKLSWGGIRAVEFADDTDTAHLTATNGDSFTIQLSTATLGLETGFGKTELPVKLIRSIKVSLPAKPNGFIAPGAKNETDLRLTIDLRDGSHLVGKGLDETLNFHSTAMGDLKLTWAGIRSIEYGTKDTDTAQLTAANGDVYEVQFVPATVGVETSFGKNQVPVKLIRSIRVSAVGGGGEHLIGWWKLDDGTGTVAKDSGGTPDSHDGNLVNGPIWTQLPGQGEVSLQFNGANQYVSLGNILQGSYTEISIACWVKHAGSGWGDIVERSAWDKPDGIGLWMNDNNASVSFGHFYDNDVVHSKAGVQDDQWHHVVGTMSQTGSNYIYSIYVDGKLDNTVTSSMGLTATSNGWAIGARYDGMYSYRGLIQDVRIYDRALSDAEVAEIYAQQDHGEPSPTTPPPAPPAPSPPSTPVEDTSSNKLIQMRTGTITDSK